MTKKEDFKTINFFLNFLNEKYLELHTAYEDCFWQSYMGDHSIDEMKDSTKKAFDNFKSDESILETINYFIKKANKEEKIRLTYWRDFFAANQTPIEVKGIKNEIDKLETKLHKIRTTRKEGYIDPKTKKFVKASYNSMRSIMSTNPDEKVRKACFDATQELAKGNVDSYIKIVNLKNEYARKLGYEDFYAYKLAKEEKLTKKELFSLFDSIYEKTKYAFKNIRDLEKKNPGLRKPWNYGYMMVGDIQKDEEPYYPFENSLELWLKSFSSMGIDFKGGTLKLDLLDRKGKYSNGFCHWPELVHFVGNKRMPARAQLTCNVVLGKIGQSVQGMNTLFHEGGHAAHLLNSNMRDVCLNSEYPPMSTAWAETQSMFLDTVFSSVEWSTRYAKNKQGEPYPFALYQKEVEKLSPVSPLRLMGIIMITQFEKEIYEHKKLTSEVILKIAKKQFKLHTDRSEDSLNILEVPHIYSWESSCSYQGYGLATLALTQWREYFFKKYGYIVDNPHIGEEMTKVWELGSSKSFPEFVKLATGKKLSADAFIKGVTLPVDKKLKLAKEKIAKLENIPLSKKDPKLTARILLVHGKETIADSKDGFKKMCLDYSTWLKTQN